MFLTKAKSSSYDKCHNDEQEQTNNQMYGHNTRGVGPCIHTITIYCKCTIYKVYGKKTSFSQNILGLTNNTKVHRKKGLPSNRSNQLTKLNCPLPIMKSANV